MATFNKSDTKENINADVIDLREFISVLWKEKKLITTITFIFAIGSMMTSLFLPNYYSSESLLIAREDTQNSGILSQYSGLASLAGVSIPSGDNAVTEIIEIIKSREFLKHLITFDYVLPSIMAAKSYDAVSKELYYDPNIYDAKTKTWLRKTKETTQNKPSYLEAHGNYIKNLLSISEDKVTGVISIRIEHISPVFAKNFLELIITEANTLKREKDIYTSVNSLSYLREELSQTPYVEIKESINSLIKAQLERQMFAKVNDEYVLVTIEPPFVPEEKSKPNRTQIVIISAIFGLLFSSLYLLFFYQRKLVAENK